MTWSVLAQLLWLVIDVLAVVRLSKQEKDIEVLLLRQQLRVLEQKQRHPPRITRWEKLTLAVLAAWLKARTARGRNRLTEFMLRSCTRKRGLIEKGR